MSKEGEIRFGGVPNIPSPEEFREAASHNPGWYQLLEQAYQTFADRPENAGIYPNPKEGGATLLQVWRFFTVFGVEPQCILVRDLSSEAAAGIPILVRRSPQELVEILKRLDALRGDLNVPTLHYDGQTGHCIRLIRYQPRTDRFVYHDPWPFDSLLCGKNNVASVNARKEGTRWTVSADELERVIFAAFVMPYDWASLEGDAPAVKQELALDEWQRGEFYRFFHLVELNHREEAGLDRRLLAPQNFKDNVSLIIDSDSSGRIFSASLILDRRWHRRNPLLALDIAKSFISCFAPLADQTDYAELSSRLRGLRDPAVARELIDAGPQQSKQNLLLLCFLGFPVEVKLVYARSTLMAHNVKDSAHEVFEMVFDLK